MFVFIRAYQRSSDVIKLARICQTSFILSTYLHCQIHEIRNCQFRRLYGYRVILACNSFYSLRKSSTGHLMADFLSYACYRKPCLLHNELCMFPQRHCGMQSLSEVVFDTDDRLQEIRLYKNSRASLDNIPSFVASGVVFRALLPVR